MTVNEGTWDRGIRFLGGLAPGLSRLGDLAGEGDAHDSNGSCAWSI
jgi:hypothetical protein